MCFKQMRPLQYIRWLEDQALIKDVSDLLRHKPDKKHSQLSWYLN